MITKARILALSLCLALSVEAGRKPPAPDPLTCQAELDSPARVIVLMEALRQTGSQQETLFAELYDKAYSRVVSSLRVKLSGSQAQNRADDFVQEAFLKYWQMAPPDRPSKIGWFHVAAMNLSLSHLAKRDNEARASIGNGTDEFPEYDVADVGSKPTATTPAPLDLQDQNFLGWRVARLPDEQRRATELYLKGISVERVAEEMNLTAKQVKYHYEKALARLRLPLEACPVDNLTWLQREAVLSLLTEQERSVYVLHYRGESFAALGEEFAVHQNTALKRFHSAEEKLKPFLRNASRLEKRVVAFIASDLFLGVPDGKIAAMKRAWRRLAENDRDTVLGRWEGINFTTLSKRQRRKRETVIARFNEAMEAFGKVLGIGGNEMDFAHVPGTIGREQEMPLDLFVGLSASQRVRLPSVLTRLSPEGLHALIRRRDRILFSKIGAESDLAEKDAVQARFARAIEIVGEELDVDDLVLAPPFRNSRRAEDIAPRLFVGLEAGQIERLEEILAALSNEQLDVIAWKSFGRSVRQFGIESGIPIPTGEERYALAMEKIRAGLKLTADKLKFAPAPVGNFALAKKLPNPFVGLSDPEVEKLQPLLAQLSGEQLEVLEYYGRGHTFQKMGEEMGMSHKATARRFANAMTLVSRGLGKPADDLQFGRPEDHAAKARALADHLLVSNEEIFQEALERALTNLSCNELQVLMWRKEGLQFNQMGSLPPQTATSRHWRAIRKLAAELGVPEASLVIQPQP